MFQLELPLDGILARHSRLFATTGIRHLAEIGASNTSRRAYYFTVTFTVEEWLNEPYVPVMVTVVLPVMVCATAAEVDVEAWRSPEYCAVKL